MKLPDFVLVAARKEAKAALEPSTSKPHIGKSCCADQSREVTKRTAVSKAPDSLVKCASGSGSVPHRKSAAPANRNVGTKWILVVYEAECQGHFLDLSVLPVYVSQPLICVQRGNGSPDFTMVTASLLMFAIASQPPVPPPEYRAASVIA